MATINLKTRYQRVGLLNAERYITFPVRYSNISSEDLIKYASDNSGIAKAQMAASFYALMQQVEQFLANGHGLILGNMGSLYLALDTTAATSEADAGASAVNRICVRFRQSKKLQTLLNSSISLNTLKSATSNTTTTGSDAGGGTGGSGGSGGSSDTGGESGGQDVNPLS